MNVVVADSHGGGAFSTITASGELAYYNDTYEAYHDVDKAPNRSKAVVVARSDM